MSRARAALSVSGAAITAALSFCEEIAMAVEQGFLVASGNVRLYYEVYGTGDARTPLVFPNGLYLADDFQFLAENRRVIFYDPRQRGRSDAVEPLSEATVGIERDVDDLDAVRRHFGVERIDLIGHSYAGLLVALYAARHRDRIGRIVQLGPPPFNPSTQYPPEFTPNDNTLQEVLGALAQMQKDPEPRDPEERCRRFWSVLRAIYVADPKNADRISWGRCDLANERNMLRYWTVHMLPSIQRLDLKAGAFATVRVPVLIVHGRKDRSSPYGGALDWAKALPDARLVTIDDAAHAPWIEAPDLVFGAIREFLEGR